MNFFKHSIIARLGAAMLAISMMALIGMISSVIVAESTQGDAAGINLAGSLRMMSYRIISETQLHEDEASEVSLMRVKQSIEEFDRRLRSPVLANVMPGDDDHELTQQYNKIMQKWQKDLSPALLVAVEAGPAGYAEYVDQVEQYVPEIDQMVLLLERSTESKIKLLSLVQGISLFMTVLIIFIALYDIKSNVTEPLGQLLQMAKDAGQGKLDSRVYFESEDELGVLASTFNQMAEELSKIYADLENRVQRKTSELRNSNESLQLLYQATKRFNRDEDICHRLMPVLKHLEAVTPVGPISVTLSEPNQDRNYRQLTTQRLERPVDCGDQSCNDCLVNRMDTRDHETITRPIKTREAFFGEMSLQYQADNPPTDDQIQLIETIIENLGTVLSLELKAEREQQMSLLEERAVIARELHDSLAQSLSYLKMQVTRLQLLRKKEAEEEQIDDVVGELKEGLNNAYRQLRELLTTFRLTLDQPGLYPALEKTVAEFSDRLGFPVQLAYGITHQTLSPNEEIHVLQLVREALANVVKHAQASDVSVNLKQQNGTVEVRIEDNGKGIPDNQDMTNHYGLVIMRDRATTLGGHLQVFNRDDCGVCVQMTFRPKAKHNGE